MDIFALVVFSVWTVLMFAMMASTGDGAAGGIGLVLSLIGFIALIDEKGRE